MERGANDHPVADDERRQRAALHRYEGGLDADLLLGEGLATRECEGGVARGECVEALRVFGANVGEETVGPIP